MESNNQQIVFKGVKIELLEANLLRFEIENNVAVDLELAKDLHHLANSLSEVHPYKVLTVFNRNFFPSAEAMNYMAGDIRSEKILAEAFCINSASLKLISNFYFRIKKPIVNCKVFDNEKMALRWLSKF